MGKRPVCFSLSVFLCFLSFFPAAAAETVADAEKKWTLAAAAFTVENEEKNSVLDSASKILPQLILEEFSNGSAHIISVSEQEARAGFESQEERKKLFTDLSQQIQARDLVVFNTRPYSQYTVNRLIKEKETVIAETEKKLAENITGLKKRLDEITAAAFEKSAEVSLWKNDPSQLYELSSDGKEKDPFQDGVSALITGSLSSLGPFVQLTVNLTGYPGKKHIETVTDIGSLANLQLLARSVAGQLIDDVANAQPVTLRIRVVPEPVSSDTALHIDGVLYKNTGSDIVVAAGTHTLDFALSGYDTARFTKFFPGGGVYSVHVVMRPLISRDVYFTAEPETGSLYLQAVPQGEFPGKITVNGEITLGEFFSDSETSTYFKLTLPSAPIAVKKQAVSVAVPQIRIQPSSADFMRHLESERKWMYVTYGFLLVAVPVSVVLFGNYINVYNRWALGLEDQAKVDAWKLASDISMGASIAIGVQFVLQAGKFLYTANQVLPREYVIK